MIAMLMTFKVTAMTRKAVRGKPRSGTCGHINAFKCDHTFIRSIEGWSPPYHFLTLWMRMRSSRVVRASLLPMLKVATVLDSIPPSSDTVEAEGRQMKQC
jgi:hypothetical protein